MRDNLPKDPVMLLSVINTALRDEYSSLDALCEDKGFNKEEIINSLSKVNYSYNEDLNQFK
ncbi:MAG: DUF4250 domain-containing protein [Lachnospiraceae bacterium]|nr:DUF4250 domain-containing protein [Lachnospiraceae bacterium]